VVNDAAAQLGLGAISGARFRGRLGDYHIRLAIGFSGGLELELIEWVSGETPHREFLEAGRSGMHHVSFHVPDVDAVIERARGLGYDAIWYHRMDPQLAYSYLERPGDPLILELTERPWSGGNVDLSGGA
jgi:catechol 2,3-dioxygenase-like lactoylglutathione lyase family enzyme